MSLSREDSRLVSEQDVLLNVMERDAVQNTMHALFQNCADADVPCAKDDRCAAVEAAVIRYIIASRKDAGVGYTVPQIGANPAALEAALTFAAGLGGAALEF